MFQRPQWNHKNQWTVSYKFIAYRWHSFSLFKSLFPIVSWNRVISRWSKMDILKTAKFHLRVLGCLPIDWIPPFSCSKSLLNRIHICLIFALLIQNLASTIWFWQFEAKSSNDNSNSKFFCLRSFLCLVLYSRLVWQRHRINRLFCSLEETITKSKWITGWRRVMSVPSVRMTSDEKFMLELIWLLCRTSSGYDIWGYQSKNWTNGGNI